MKDITTLFMLRLTLATILTLSLCPLKAGTDGPIRKLHGAEAVSAAIRKVMPAYPAIARQLRIAGTVELEVSIDEKGRVDDVRALSGNPVLTKPAMDALRLWKFTPSTLNDSPVRSIATITLDMKP